MTIQNGDDPRIPKRLTVELDQANESEPLTGRDFLHLVLGLSPRAGTYSTEMHCADGSVEVETRVVDENGRITKHEVTPQASSHRRKRRKTKKKKS